MNACIYVRQRQKKKKKKVHSPLAGGSISDRLPFSMATSLSGAGPPHPPPSHLPFLPAKDPYRRSAAPEAAGRAARIGSPGSSPTPVPTPCSVLPCGSCHVTETPTLGCVCQQWPCAQCAIYGNPWGRQEGGVEWESICATLRIVSCSEVISALVAGR